MVTHRIRVLRDGETVTVVNIDDYDIACDWAMTYMRLQRDLDVYNGKWATVLESGVLWWDPYCKAPDIFVPDGELKEGLVLDKKLLHDPSVDMNMLFGQK